MPYPSGMSPRALRVAAIPSALIAGGVSVGSGTFAPQGSGRFVVGLAGFAAVLAVYAGWTRRSIGAAKRSGSGGLWPDAQRGRFLAGTWPRTLVIPAYAYGYVAGHAVAGNVRRDYGYGLDRFDVIIAVLAFVVMVMIALVDPTAVGLTRTGVLIRRELRGRTYAWDEIRSAAVSGAGRRRQLTVYLHGPLIDGRFTPSAGIAVRDLWADPYRLATAINVYAADPDRRAEIGDPAELDRLSRDITIAEADLVRQ